MRRCYQKNPWSHALPSISIITRSLAIKGDCVAKLLNRQIELAFIQALVALAVIAQTVGVSLLVRSEHSNVRFSLSLKLCKDRFQLLDKASVNDIIGFNNGNTATFAELIFRRITSDNDFQ